MSDGTVKIGQSSNVRNRTTEIERQTGLTAQKVYFTPKMSREDARLIEWACQKNFSSRRVKGEFFSVAFAEACAVVDSFAKVLTAPHNSKLIAAVPTKLIADKKLD